MLKNIFYFTTVRILLGTFSRSRTATGQEWKKEPIFVTEEVLEGVDII